MRSGNANTTVLLSFSFILSLLFISRLADVNAEEVRTAGEPHLKLEAVRVSDLRQLSVRSIASGQVVQEEVVLVGDIEQVIDQIFEVYDSEEPIIAIDVRRYKVVSGSHTGLVWETMPLARSASR